MRFTMNSKPPETRPLKTHEDPEDAAYHRLPPLTPGRHNGTILAVMTGPTNPPKYGCASQSLSFQAEEMNSK